MAEQKLGEMPLTLFILTGAALIYLFLSRTGYKLPVPKSMYHTSNIPYVPGDPWGNPNPATVTIPPALGVSPGEAQSANDAWNAALAAGRVGYGTQADRDRLRMLGPNGQP